MYSAIDEWAVTIQPPHREVMLIDTYINLREATKVFNELEQDASNGKVAIYQLFTDNLSGYHGKKV